uniref:Uncharacterized protein n=1 Tax=Myotis myotis TaxID=51298 RepID=A0A7J7WHJ2_MYOMY|nr:hypothetical protein mMyoMyo1_012013 [Myotis myotis]
METESLPIPPQPQHRDLGPCRLEGEFPAQGLRSGPCSGRHETYPSSHRSSGFSHPLSQGKDKGHAAVSCCRMCPEPSVLSVRQISALYTDLSLCPSGISASIGSQRCTQIYPSVLVGSQHPSDLSAVHGFIPLSYGISASIGSQRCTRIHKGPSWPLYHPGGRAVLSP